MKPSSLVICHLSSVILLSACTQTPAQISLRGKEQFARGNTTQQSNRSYVAPVSSAYSVSNNRVAAYHTTVDNSPTVSSARIDSIGVSDLPPPSSTNTPPSLTKESPIKPALRESSSGFIWPVQGKVISKFGPKGGGRSNDGINIAAPAGEPVYAASGGEVVYVGDELKGYGKMVIIRHSAGKHSSYAHMQKYSVDRYDRVKQGDIIGYVGQTGNVSEPQLHFAIRENKQPVNPVEFLPSDYAGL